MIRIQSPKPAALAVLVLTLWAPAAHAAQAVAPFGAYAELEFGDRPISDGGVGSFSASKSFESYNSLGDGVVGSSRADMATAKLHSFSRVNLESCIESQGICSEPIHIVSKAAMWDTITFHSKDGGPVQNISLLPTYLEIDGHLQGDGARAMYRTYWGYDPNYDVSSLPWEDLGDGTRESLDSLIVPVGENPLYVYFELRTSASIHGVFDEVSNADFGDTMSFNWVLPDDLTFTSASGTFLTGGVDAVPEPASWAMMIVGFGLVGLTVRGRTRSHVGAV